MKRFVYADNAATTQISDRCLGAMLPFLKEHYGNPSSTYSMGQYSKKAIELAREQVAKALNADPVEIYFTGCGTESDNWALKSVMELGRAKGKTHLITTNFEHHAILHTAKHLEKLGFTVTYLPVDSEGYVTAEQVKQAITEQTALVSIMYANNEIGTIQPIAEIGAVCKEAGVLFHTDAVQAVGQVPIDVKAQHIDLLSLSGHKIHAPKGIGALYCKRTLRLPNLLDGGAQERDRRGGTENLASIVGLGAAIEEAVEYMAEKAARLSALRDRLIDGILASVPKCRLNGGRSPRLPGNVNLAFEAIEGEALLLQLDLHGVSSSSGSACTSGSLDPSHVLLAIGLPKEIAHGSLRLSFSDGNTQEDVDYLLEVIPKVVQLLRDMSPIWNG